MFKSVWDIFFPIECSVCEKYGSHLCDDCFEYLVDMTSYERCFGCHKQTLLGKICSDCAQDYAFSRVYIGSDYSIEYVQGIIWNLKYGFVKDIAETCAALIAHGLLENRVFDILGHQQVDLIPIPLHRSKFRIREYNQAEEIAKKVRSKLKGSAVIDGVIKTRKTDSQTEFAAHERMKNVAGSFAWMGERRSDVACIVDDVITTGSTAHEVAKVLKEAGYSEIYVLAVARSGG